MKVIHYIPSIDRASGGTTAYMQLLADKLGKLVELHVVSHESDNPVTLDNCRIHYISPFFSGRMKREWQLMIAKIGPDVVHVNCCWMPGCAFAQKWAQQMGVKVVLSPHGMLEPWIMARHYWTRKLPALLLYQKRAVLRADGIHATADSEKDNLLRLGYNDKIEVIANGIDVDKIDMKRSWRRNREILFLSRVHVKKGINFLVEAVASLKDELDGYCVKVAGEGDENYINELRQLAVRLGVEHMIKFVGGVYGDSKWELFRHADVFVLPTHSENFGIVVAESLACGTPVITTKGTPWQELETAGCGWWTEIGADALTAALRKFIALTDDELERMGRNGRRLVEEKYSSRKMAEDMVKLYTVIKSN